MLSLVREGLDQQLVRFRKDRALRLYLQPFTDVVGKPVPVVAVGEHLPDPVGEVGRHRHSLPAVGDDARPLRRSMDDDVRVLELLDLEAEPGDEEMIAGRQCRSEALLDRAKLAAVPEADGEEWLLDDDSGIQPMLLGDARPGNAPPNAGLRPQA